MRSRSALPALSAHDKCGEITVGGRSVTVCVPIGATESRPIVLVAATAPARDTCEALQRVARAYPFVVCPTFDPSRDDRISLEELSKRFRSSLAALKKQYGAHVDPGSILLVARGTLADQSVFIAQQEPSFFRRLALIDGGTATFSAGFASVFSQRNGERVLFVCSDDACRARAEVKATLADRSGIEGRVVRARAASDGASDAWHAAVAEGWGWLVAGDARYRRAEP